MWVLKIWFKLFDWTPKEVSYPKVDSINKNECNATDKLSKLKNLNNSNIFVTCSGKVDLITLRI